VVNRYQSTAARARLHPGRTSGRGEASLYQVHGEFSAGFSASKSVSHGIGKAIGFLLRGYKRLISPFLPSACRFHPTCSEYMRQAVEIHGPAQGVWLGLKRLSRCHPFHEGGFDPVPR